ncbi:uncharacterized protein LAJ45_02724 [Morchella importuna]|uniref:uncharacterized protein n=1 Tax=Morchella importuna TaxID=1174673 RepID=UPI001E8E8D0E|nr:uncharacterized protein LAJ45_02724 [Morchella importuna]KAH8153137.1 hypothetical protein LAJ45_02724 [Morchella importuna]
MNATLGSPPPSNGHPERSTLHHRNVNSRTANSIHQTPPPIDNGLLIPTGAVLSPPDSSQNSSDEDDVMGRGKRRGRNLGNLEEQLKEAIKNIPQRRAPSPDSSIKPMSPSDGESKRGRHQRSISESTLLNDYGLRPDSNSDSDYEDDGYRMAPPMVRKKSGEVVKSSLKTPNRSRPVSMPSTPTFPKAVHFDAHLEHVRHFLHQEKPSAVSAGSSPVESFDGEREFPFPHEEAFRSREPPFEWEINLPNFPKDMDARKNLPVRVERVCLSNDNKNLIGTVAVNNMSFQKSVVVRFTLDHWETVSEVIAEFNSDVRKKKREEGVDRFIFNIKLVDQVNFSKKAKPQNGKNGGARVALPRSKPSNAPRPKSMPNFDELEGYDGAFFSKDSDDIPIPLLPKKSLESITDTTESLARRANPSGNAFGNRYDFGASLNAAIKAANLVVGPKRSGLGIKTDKSDKNSQESPYFKFGSAVLEVTEPRVSEVRIAKTPVVAARALRNASPDKNTSTPIESPTTVGAGAPEVFQPSAFVGEKPSIESSSYRELLDNYCFFGSAKASPQMSDSEVGEKKSQDSAPGNQSLFSGAIFSTTAEPRIVKESDLNPRYTPSPLEGSPASSFLRTSSGTGS